MSKQIHILKFELTLSSFEITGTEQKKYLLTKSNEKLLSCLIDKNRNRIKPDRVELVSYYKGLELRKFYEIRDWCYIFNNRMLQFANGCKMQPKTKDIFIKLGKEIN